MYTKNPINIKMQIHKYNIFKRMLSNWWNKHMFPLTFHHKHVVFISSWPPAFGSKSYMFRKPTKTKWLPCFEKTYNLIGECMLQCTQKLSQVWCIMVNIWKMFCDKNLQQMIVYISIYHHYVVKLMHIWMI